MKTDFKVIPARRDDAPFLGSAVVMAIGSEIAAGLAGENHTVDDVAAMFGSLAAREDTQYSYRNALVAIDSESYKVIGACIAYDGALLHELRPRFIEAAFKQLGIEFGKLEDECQPDEFYIDTLAVLPGHRGKGVATELLKETVKRARLSGKPAGLLVDKTNPRARRLYDAVGFEKVGELPFVHVVMDHLKYPE